MRVKAFQNCKVLMVFLLTPFFFFNTSANNPINFGGDESVVVKAVSLSGVVGYPELDEIQLCSGADTLTFIVYTTSEVPLTDVAMTLQFGGGIEYGGFADADMAGDLTLVDGSNVMAPIFNIANLTQDEPIIIDLGVSTNCTSLAGDYSLVANFEYSYVDPTTTITNNCSDETSFSTELFRAAALQPIMNFTNEPADIDFTVLGQVRCQTLVISQDGINATLGEFEFSINNLNLNLLDLESITANGTAITNFNYSQSNQQLVATIDDSVFPANGNPSPADNLFNEDETVTIEVCYSVPACFDGVLPTVTYQVSQICAGLDCPGVGDEVDAVMDFAPNFGIAPVYTVSLSEEAETCGMNAELAMTFRSNSTDPLLGLYENIKLTMVGCDTSFLKIADVTLNGVSLPSSSIYYSSTLGVVIDFTQISTDPDGPGGLDDVDGDGFFDDLPGDQQIDFVAYFSVQCPDITQGCLSSSCQFTRMTLEAERYCGQAFSQNTNIGAPLIGFDSEGTFDLLGTLPNDRDGYNFGQIGYISGVDDTPSSVDMGFTYNYQPSNFVSCGGTHFFQFAVSSENQIAFDMEFTNVEIDANGTGAYTPIAPGDITVIDSIDLSTRFLQVQVPNPPINTDINVRWTSTLDTSYCRPGLYFSGAGTLIEDCPAGCDCIISKACGTVTMYVDPQDTGCSCDASSIVEISRISTGFTDKTLTTKVDTSAISNNDHARFLPGDTMQVKAVYTIINPDPFNLGNGILRMDMRNEALGGNDNINRVRSLMNGQLARIVQSSIERPAAGDNWDLSTITCIDANDGDDNNRGMLIWGGHTNERPIINPGIPMTAEPPRHIGDNHGDDRRDGNYLLLDLTDNNFAYRDNVLTNDDCLNPVRDAIGGFQAGDVITVTWQVPIIRNPGFDLSNGTEVQPSVLAILQIYDRLDPTSSFVQLSNGTCWTNEVYEFWEPEIEASSEIVYDNCGATIEHTFQITNPPANWYADEFRPILGIERLATTLPPPLVYAGGAEYEDVTGTTHPLEPTGSQNSVSSFENNGVTYYSPNASNSQLIFEDAEELNGTLGSYQTASGDPSLSVDEGDNDFTRVGETIRPLSVGLDNVDSLIVRIPLARVCPGLVNNSGLDLLYNASYTTIPEYNNSVGPFTCNNSSNSSAAYYWNDNVVCSGRYWDFNSQSDDNPHRFVDLNGLNYFEAGSFSTLPSLSSGVSMMLLGDEPTTNETNRLTLTSGPGMSNLPNVVLSINIPSTVELIDVIDVASGTSLTTNVGAVTSDATIYSVLVSNSMPPGTNLEIDVVTELLLCPSQLVDPNSVPNPVICLNTTVGGCVPDEVAAAITGGTDACSNSNICYEYTGDASDIQIEWFFGPSNITLCDELTYAARIKNVRSGVLFEPEMSFRLPPGVTPQSGTWEYAYPGDLAYGSLNWQAVGSDPSNPFGNYHEYEDIGDFIAAIQTNGLPGIGAPNGENEVAIRFNIVTDCDDFISGRRLRADTEAFDGCGNIVEARDFTNPIILNDANPVDFPRFLIVAEPANLQCGVSNTSIAFTALALQGAGATANTTMCVTLPEGIDYAGAVDFTLPASFTPTNVRNTPVGTATEVCFDVPDGIAVGQLFSVEVTVDASTTLSCGQLTLETDINSVVESLACSSGANCDANVNNSLNNEVFLNIIPPLEATNLSATVACSADPAEVVYDYSIDVFNSGANNASTATIELYRDLDANGQLDDYDTLLDSDMQSLNVANGASANLSGMLTAPASISCPALLVINYGSGCGCDTEVLPLRNPEPSILNNIPEVRYLCSGEALVIDNCDAFTVSLSPSEAGTVTDMGGTIEVTLNSGFGVDSPVLLQVSGEIGTCSLSASRQLFAGPNIAEISLSDCQDNATLSDPDDDYFTVTLMANGEGTQYEVVVNANPDGSGGTVLGSTNYGESITVGDGINGITGTFAADDVTTYTITIRDVNDASCFETLTTVAVNSCSDCPILENPTPATTTCQADPIPLLSVDTDVLSPDQIDFVYFTTPQTGDAMYTGGTSLGLTTPNAGSASISDVSFPAPGTYYVYTILNTLPDEPLCRPFQEIVVTVNPSPDLTLMTESPNVCDGETATITVLASETGVTYQLRDNSNDSPVGSPVEGTGGDITFDLMGLTTGSSSYNIFATAGNTGCGDELNTIVTVGVSECDFPDFPPPICVDPACHVISPDVYFGAGVTADSPGNGDSTASTDEDDGIGFPNNIRRGIDIHLPITFYNNTGNPVYIQGWIDWDGDTNFDMDERVANLTVPFNGANLTQTISQLVNVPTDAVQDDAVAMRWRISSDPSIVGAPCGGAACAADGEVEDYLIQVECPVEVCVPAQISITRGD